MFRNEWLKDDEFNFKPWAVGYRYLEPSGLVDLR